jgi:X-X-X-Leu-X-X-Gly heptad repeat protein
MDLNYALTDLFIAERIASRRQDAGALRDGTGSPIVAIIGRGADGISRVAGQVARWADGSSELRAGAARRASIQ